MIREPHFLTAIGLILLTACLLIFCGGCASSDFGQGGTVKYLDQGDPAPFAGWLWSGLHIEPDK